MTAPPSPIQRVFHGNILHAIDKSTVEMIEDGYLGVRPDGTVAFLSQELDPTTYALPDRPSPDFIELGHKLLIPGFIDTHAHAPQYMNTGLGIDLPLLKWLEKYTFPEECKYKEEAYARHVYNRLVRRLVSNGTTTCCYFGSIHAPATATLGEIAAEVGQRALVGKVCMDRNAPDYYREADAETSLEETKAFVQQIKAIKSPLVLPVITPRFVPTCTSQLMTGLGEIAKAQDLHIQSHLSENPDEIAWVKDLHPDCETYTEVYDTHGLLTDRTVMAHCIYLDDNERALMKARGAAVAHCPNSNFTINSGICNVRRLLREGIKVGLGTDLSGGYATSIHDAMRQALVSSKVLFVAERDTQGSTAAAKEVQPWLTMSELLFLATLGGAQALHLQEETGNFLPGKSFDALVVDAEASGSPYDVRPAGQPLESLEEQLSRFVLLGDDRNIVEVYVHGARVHQRYRKSFTFSKPTLADYIGIQMANYTDTNQFWKDMGSLADQSVPEQRSKVIKVIILEMLLVIPLVVVVLVAGNISDLTLPLFCGLGMAVVFLTHMFGLIFALFKARGGFHWYKRLVGYVVLMYELSGVLLCALNAAVCYGALGPDLWKQFYLCLVWGMVAKRNFAKNLLLASDDASAKTAQ